MFYLYQLQETSLDLCDQEVPDGAAVKLAIQRKKKDE